MNSQTVKRPPSDSELVRLVDLMCNSAISPAERDHLESLLTGNRDAQLFYIAYLDLHAEMQWMMRDEAAEAEGGIAGGERRKFAARGTCDGADEKIQFPIQQVPNISFPLPPPLSSPSHSPIASSPSLGFLGSAYHGTVNFFSQEIPFACLVTTIIMGIAGVIGLNVTKEHYTQLPWKSTASVERSFSDAGEGTDDKSIAAVKEQKAEVAQWVGQITGKVDCVWANNKTAPVWHKFGMNDKFDLKSGLLEITYYSGAKVILQGPCTYEVDSASGGYLSLGKLTARVENKGAGGRGRGKGEEAVASGQWLVASENAESRNPEIPKSQNPSSLTTNHQPRATALFAVRTPTAVVTDLGTEFGVEVSLKGQTMSHVFQGRVTVRAVSVAGEVFGREVTLDANQSAEVAADADPKNAIVVKICTEAEEAVVAKSFARKIVKTDLSEYANAVLADKPLFYWTFDEPAGLAFEQTRRLKRQALMPELSATRCAHASIGSGLNLGRAADFSRDVGYFASQDLAHGQISGAWAIEFWAQFTEHKRGQYVLNANAMSPEGVPWNQPAIIFNWPEQAADNELQLFSDNGSAGYHRTHDGPIVSDRNWRHFILVFYGDGATIGTADRVDAVVDGASRKIARGKFRVPFVLTYGLLVGADTAAAENPMRGRLDELAIYDLSGLSESQIEAKVSTMARRHIEIAKKGEK